MARKSANEDMRVTLGVLAAVEAGEHLSQRVIAADLGVALGLVNAYVKRCVRKGLLKVSQVPARRYRYFLTPAGFAEKAKLTGEYLAISLSFFRRAKASYSKVFAQAEELGWRSVVLLGAGDLADIAMLCAMERGIEIVATIDHRGAAGRRSAVIVKETRVDGYVWTGASAADCLGPRRANAVRVLMPSADLLGLNGSIDVSTRA